MRRAAAVLLVCISCGGEMSPPQVFPDLVAVSGVAPWPSSCAVTAGRGTLSRDAEVEPGIAVDPADARHLIGIWQQDRWSNGGANGLVTAA
ncbi:MAG: hypothetical protein ACXWLR_09685, partial [Myxococcales bacterium]